jgi:uncharacterized damage-inducible protein DinB
MSEPVAAIPIVPDQRYPVGRFKRPETITPNDRVEAIAALSELPALLRKAVDGLDADQLRTPYRDGGWTLQQVVHHIADSHMNCFVRVRLALTEDFPLIVAYDEKAWAKLHDSEAAPIAWSLDIVDGLHARGVLLLQSLSDDDWQRGFRHPERGAMTVEMTTLLYAWHSRHHVGHITHLRVKEGW